ncbi:hypothetical protein ECC02_008046 [Trypanosoma cruzi]|uniref:Uncharacterized protein n=1 Tax=Trypanosoma cruzi TaxID=5693 RepID=A0A7J6XWQ9_TRYCR|nr:hypothetical protein ECC02_008046 [Trypanosoma cruzi]
MRGVHLAPRHAQHSALRRNHVRTSIQRNVATEHSRVQRDTATDKLQLRAVHHHRPPTSHHGHEGHARHNQHGPHKPQARQHQHRCVRRGPRAGKIHKRRRPRGNQQGVGQRRSAAPPRRAEMRGRAPAPGDGAAVGGAIHNHVTQPPRASATPRQPAAAKHQEKKNKSINRAVDKSGKGKRRYLPRASTLYRICEGFCAFPPRGGAVGGSASPTRGATAPTSW